MNSTPLKVVVGAMVLLLVGTVALTLTQDRAETTGNFLDSQDSVAQCDLLKTQGKCSEFNSQNCQGTCQTQSRESGESTSPSDNDDQIDQIESAAEDALTELDSDIE